MITGKAVKEEVENARKIVKTEEGKALLKILEVLLKLIGSVRRNTTKIMEFLGIEPDEPRKKEEVKKE
jgi:hypothetical protein